MRLSQKQKILFIDNMWSLLNSWIPIFQVLDIIYFQTKAKNTKSLCLFLKKQIEAWENLFKASLKIPKVFNIFDVAMLEVWEATWQIWKSFETIAIKEEKEMDLKNKIIQALIYPIAIIIITITMITVIMIYVIPKIEVMYKESNTNLPALTEIVIATSHFFVNNWIYIIIFLSVLILWSISLLKNKEIKYFFDKHILKIPLFWWIIKKKILINFLDFLSILLSSWIMINKALLIIKNWSSNNYFAQEFENIIQEIKNGKPLSSSMGWDLLEIKLKQNSYKISKNEMNILQERAELFPIELSTAVKIWEQTWTLAQMLQKTSFRYTKEIDNIVKNLSTIMEPVIIVVIGLVVWVIVMAILLPFFNVANVVK